MHKLGYKLANEVPEKKKKTISGKLQRKKELAQQYINHKPLHTTPTTPTLASASQHTHNRMTTSNQVKKDKESTKYRAPNMVKLDKDLK